MPCERPPELQNRVQEIRAGTSGTHYNWFRDYETASGTYSQSDPSGLFGGLNVYLYSDGNPVMTSDASGLAPLSYDETRKLVVENSVSEYLSHQFIICLIWKESGFNILAKSKTTTATGLMQMTKGAVVDVKRNYTGFDRITHEDMTTAAAAIAAGSAYLDLRIDWARGDMTKGVNGYGTGSGYIDDIQKCEGCLKKAPENNDCKGSNNCLELIHK